MSFDNSYYPQIFYPSSYKQIINSSPKIPVLPVIPNKPIEPNKAYQGSKESGCISSLAALLLISLGIICFVISPNYKDRTMIFVGLFFCGVGVIALWLNYSIEASYHKEKEKYDNEYLNLQRYYQEEMVTYSIKMKEYEQENKKYNEDIKIFESSEYISQYRLNELSKYFSSIPQKNVINSKSSHFYLYYKKFSDLLLNTFEAQIFLFEKSATIIDKNSKISITIKIDNPNDINTGTDSITDCISSKVLEVFFAQSQIESQPKECIEFIYLLIGNIKSFLPTNKNESRINLVKTWSSEKAISNSYNLLGFEETQKLLAKKNYDDLDLPF